MLFSLKNLLIIFTLFFTFSCATTKPNIPISDQIPELAYIEQQNALLATELKKLPELQDGLKGEEKKALREIADLYREHQADFDSAFEEMYQVGLPEHRKYCSPLQAMFWLFEDGKHKDARKVIENYSLEKLLAKGWFKERDLLSQNDAERIIRHIANPEKREFYMQFFQRVDNAQFMEYV